MASPRWIADRPVAWVEGSLEAPESLDRLVAGAGTVLHLAGVVTADSADGFDRANRDGTARLMDAVRAGAPHARIVYVSSLAAAGPASGPAGIGPEADPSPVSDYGRSKLGGELAVASLGDGVRWCIVRPPAIYGPRDTDMYELFKMAGSGIAAIPAGERWLTVAYVADVVVDVLAAAATEVDDRVFHLGEPEPLRLDDLIRRLGAADGRRVRILKVPPATVLVLARAAIPLRRLGLWRTALTRDKAREAMQRFWTSRTADSLARLGTGAPTDLESGAATTWAWYRHWGWLS
jgi:nucleoside-diphosphate-sugar epimerase